MKLLRRLRRNGNAGQTAKNATISIGEKYQNKWRAMKIVNLNDAPIGSLIRSGFMSGLETMAESLFEMTGKSLIKQIVLSHEATGRWGLMPGVPVVVATAGGDVELVVESIGLRWPTEVSDKLDIRIEPDPNISGRDRVTVPAPSPAQVDIDKFRQIVRGILVEEFAALRREYSEKRKQEQSNEL